jgi:spermidine synthase
MRRTLGLYAVVSVSGAAVLAIEILGTRILGPFYGVSLFLWSALITVTLAALSIGYAVGGRWADRGTRIERLGMVLCLAGLWTVAIPWLRHPLLTLTEPLGLRAAVLVTSAVLFGPPLALLGIVSPYAVKLRAQRLEDVGRTAGNIFAVSTVASVASALATGFVLIPSVGVHRLTLGIGLALLLTGAAAMLTSSARPGKVAGAAALALAVVGSILRPTPSAGNSASVIRVAQSAYAELRVVDMNDTRYLLVDGGIHTIRAQPEGYAMHPYAVVTDLAKLFFDAPGRLLVLGLGGGSIATSFAADGWRVDAVEIDPAVVRIARDAFALDERVQVHVRDGRRFLAENEGPWDVIVFDAYGSGSIPFHLVTREVFAECRRRLAPGGLLLLNVEGRGWQDPIFSALAATLHTSFKSVVALPTSEPPNVLGNMVLIATDRDRVEFAEDRLEQPYAVLLRQGAGWLHWATVQRNHAWNNRFEPAAERAVVLTDDLNPVDLWAEEINLVARRELHKFFGDKAPTW